MLDCTGHVQVEVKDGLVAMQESEAASYDAIILDAGSNDAALAISCPPAAFLEASFLEQASKSLKPTGSLVINCVTRSDTAITGVLKSLQVDHQSHLLCVKRTFFTAFFCKLIILLLSGSFQGKMTSSNSSLQKQGIYCRSVFQSQIRLKALSNIPGDATLPLLKSLESLSSIHSFLMEQVFFGDGISFLEVEEDVNRVIFAPKSGTHIGKKLAAPAAQIVDAHVQELDVDQKEWLIDELSSLNFNKP